MRRADGTTTFGTHAVDAADRQGALVLDPEPPRPPAGPQPPRGRAALGPAKGTGHRRSFKAVNPPVDPATGQPVEHLVQRQLVPGRRARARHRRQPALHGRVAGRQVRRPQPRLHVRPVHRALDAPAQHAARALVPDPAADAGRPHASSWAASTSAATATRTRTSSCSRRRARARGRGRLRLLGGRRRARRSRPARRSATTTRTCSGCRAGAGWWPGRGRPTPGGSRRRATRRGCAGRTSRTPRRAASGAPPCSCPRDRTARTRSMQLGGSDKPKADSFEPDGDALATNSVSLFDERKRAARAGTTPSSVRARRAQPAALARQHRAAARRLDGRRSAAAGATRRAAARTARPAQWAAADFHLTTELWNPRTQDAGASGRRSASSAPTTRPRVLLPDGRVVSAGDDYNGRFTGAEAARNFTQDSAEIYEPPYLFDGNRKAPAAATRGRAQAHRPGTSTVTPAGASARAADRPVTRAVLVAPVATTHAVDMNQRYVPLRVTAKTRARSRCGCRRTRTSRCPATTCCSCSTARGTPSVARWVRLG